MMSPEIFSEKIKSRFPNLSLELTAFESGVFIVDFETVGGRYCVEYFPEFGAFGLSKIDQVSPFFEGVEERYFSFADLEIRISELIE